MRESKRLAGKELLRRLGEDLDLQAEVVLDDEIRGHPVAPHASPVELVFVTGATGYLGAFLLQELLVQTEAVIHCLVRAADATQGMARIRENLERYRVWNPEYRSRIIPEPGDLAKPLLGLEPARFAALASTVDAVYHNGAVVNLVFPYTFLKPTNVNGTHEALRLAARHRSKAFHHVSTDGVFLSAIHAGTQVRECISPQPDPTLRYGYMQSKWVADRLVAAAGRRGLPVVIYRPTFISWHTDTGVYNDKDFVCGMIGGCLELGAFPKADIMLDTVPVDYVSKAIVHIANHSYRQGHAYHLCNPQPTSWQAIIDMIAALGYPAQQEPYSAWKTRLDRAQSSRLYQQFNSMLPEANSDGEDSITRFLTADKLPAIDASNTRGALAGTRISCAPLDRDQLDVYLNHLHRLQEAGELASDPLQQWRSRRHMTRGVQQGLASRTTRRTGTLPPKARRRREARCCPYGS